MSEGGDDSSEKTHEPTPQKLQKAREKGDIAKSDDVTVAAAYLGLLTAMTLGASGAAQGLGSALSAFLAIPDKLAGPMLGPGGDGLAADLFGRAAMAVLPLFILPALFALAALLGQRAIIFAPSKIEPKLSKISPIQGAKKKFGITGLVEFAKSAFKLVAISTALGIIIGGGIERFIAAALLPGDALPSLLREEGLRLLTAVTVVALAIAAFDYVWRLFDHRRKQMMTHKELRDESKEAEGDPHVKQSRRQRGREIAMNRMMADVPSADVVIVNPTHYAVALKWSRARGAAPVCVAKGVDGVALRIRESAEEHKVPVFSDPPAARALHEAVEIGAEIPPLHYRAVATAIQFADRIRQRARARR